MRGFLPDARVHRLDGLGLERGPVRARNLVHAAARAVLAPPRRASAARGSRLLRERGLGERLARQHRRCDRAGPRGRAAGARAAGLTAVLRSRRSPGATPLPPPPEAQRSVAASHERRENSSLRSGPPRAPRGTSQRHTRCSTGVRRIALPRESAERRRIHDAPALSPHSRRTRSQRRRWRRRRRRRPRAPRSGWLRDTIARLRPEGRRVPVWRTLTGPAR